MNERGIVWKRRVDVISSPSDYLSDEQRRRFLQSSTEGRKRAVGTLLRKPASCEPLLRSPLRAERGAGPCLPRSRSSARPAWPASPVTRHFQPGVSQAVTQSWNHTKPFCAVPAFVCEGRWGKRGLKLPVPRAAFLLRQEEGRGEPKDAPTRSGASSETQAPSSVLVQASEDQRLHKKAARSQMTFTVSSTIMDKAWLESGPGHNTMICQGYLSCYCPCRTPPTCNSGLAAFRASPFAMFC